MDTKQHALLSPSSSHRWLVCTPSAKLEALEEIRNPSKPSIYAEEGTEAHTLSEIKLSYQLGKISADQYNKKLEEFILNSKYYNESFNDFTDDACREVMDVLELDYKGEEVEVYLEEKVQYTDLVPDGEGTSDVVIVGRSFIHVIDFKFGQGVPVSAVGNPQLRLYGLGAIRKFAKSKLIIDVRMTIIQPRLNEITSDQMLLADLEDWGESVVKPQALLAYDGLGELVPGDHCRFCKRRGICEALGNYQLQEAKQEFENNVVVVDEVQRVLKPSEMDAEALSRILLIAPKFTAWFEEVKAYVTAQMINNGLEIPGYKVVEGRSNRVITDPGKVMEILEANNIEKPKYLSEPTLLGISTLESNIGKKRLSSLIEEYVIKPIGKPTIADIDDKRPALNTNQYKLVGQEFDEN